MSDIPRCDCPMFSEHDDDCPVRLRIAELEQALQTALGALADIAHSDDMDLNTIRAKAARVYREVTKDE